MTSERKVWMNGEFVAWENATVPLLSHGFSRASAIFEVFGTHKGPDGLFAFRMDEHLKRLAQSALSLEMELTYSSQEIAAAVIETAKINSLGRGLIKILVLIRK